MPAVACVGIMILDFQSKIHVNYKILSKMRISDGLSLCTYSLSITIQE